MIPHNLTFRTAYVFHGVSLSMFPFNIFGIQGGKTALIFACMQTKLTVVRRLLHMKADPNIPNNVRGKIVILNKSFTSSSL